MTLEQYEKIIEKVDRKIKLLLQDNNDDQHLLASMLDDMPQVKTVIDNLERYQMDKLCQKYENFCHYMKVLEKLAEFVAKQAY
jgi:hypothetical protein